MIFDRHASLYVSILLHNRQGKSQHLITTHASLYQCKRLNCGTNSAADRIQNIYFSNSYIVLMEYETLLRAKTDHYGHLIASAIIH